MYHRGRCQAETPDDWLLDEHWGNGSSRMYLTWRSPVDSVGASTFRRNGTTVACGYNHWGRTWTQFSLQQMPAQSNLEWWTPIQISAENEEYSSGLIAVWCNFLFLFFNRKTTNAWLRFFKNGYLLLSPIPLDLWTLCVQSCLRT